MIKIGLRIKHTILYGKQIIINQIRLLYILFGICANNNRLTVESMMICIKFLFVFFSLARSLSHPTNLMFCIGIGFAFVVIFADTHWKQPEQTWMPLNKHNILCTSIVCIQIIIQSKHIRFNSIHIFFERLNEHVDEELW